jgi:hypothetical protein
MNIAGSCSGTRYCRSYIHFLRWVESRSEIEANQQGHPPHPAALPAYAHALPARATALPSSHPAVAVPRRILPHLSRPSRRSGWSSRRGAGISRRSVQPSRRPAGFSRTCPGLSGTLPGRPGAPSNLPAISPGHLGGRPEFPANTPAFPAHQHEVHRATRAPFTSGFALAARGSVMGPLPDDRRLTGDRHGGQARDRLSHPAPGELAMERVRASADSARAASG